MRFLFHLVLFLGVSLGIGFGLSYIALEKGALFGTIRVGPWLAWSQVGIPEPDPYTQAFMARNGALELARAEGIRFTAENDSNGQTLRRECSYRLKGTMPTSAMWTLLATDKEGISVTRQGAILALNNSRLVRESNGSVILYAGPVLREKNWLDIRGNGPFLLILNLYDSAIFSNLDAGESLLPSITLEGCQ